MSAAVKINKKFDYHVGLSLSSDAMPYGQAIAADVVSKGMSVFLYDWEDQVGSKSFVHDWLLTKYQACRQVLIIANERYFTRPYTMLEATSAFKRYEDNMALPAPIVVMLDGSFHGLAPFGTRLRLLDCRSCSVQKVVSLCWQELESLKSVY